MPIASKNPLVLDGKTYPYLTAQLIVNPRIEVASIGAHVVLNMQPFRITEDNTLDVLTDPKYMRTELISDAFQRAQDDPAVGEALSVIFGAIETFIDAKGY